MLPYGKILTLDRSHFSSIFISHFLLINLIEQYSQLWLPIARKGDRHGAAAEEIMYHVEVE